MSLPVEAIHKVMVACRGQEVAGNCVVAMSVHSSVEFDDDVDSSSRQVAFAAAAYAVEAALGVDSDDSDGFGDSDDLESWLELAMCSSAESAVAVVIETRIRCPVKSISRKC